LLAAGMVILVAAVRLGVGLHNYLKTIRFQASLESANQQLASTNEQLETVNTEPD
jgi:hypothetical protein